VGRKRVGAVEQDVGSELVAGLHAREDRRRRLICRHCERSDLSAEALAKAEAIQNPSPKTLDLLRPRAPRNDEIEARARRSTITARAACSDLPREHAKARRTDDRLESRIALLLGKDKAGLGIGALGGLVADQERYRRPGKSSRPPLLQRMRDQ
jgi:hypothetical protein